MPTVLSFHGKYWNGDAAEGGEVAPSAAAPRPGYPAWQASVIVTAVTFWPPFAVLRPWWARVVLVWRWAWRVWAMRPADVATLDTVLGLNAEQRAVVGQVMAAMSSHEWDDARARVRACATTLGFNHPEMWIQYSRVIKADAGMAQNVFRHAKVVQELRQTFPKLGNPKANLLAELAYVGFAAKVS